MNIHEFQAQDLFRKYDIPVPKGVVAKEGDNISAIVNSLPFDNICIKAQIYAGGRGKGRFRQDLGYGGVKVASSKAEATTIANNMLGNVLITKQTGESGRTVRTLYLTETVAIAHEYYIAISLDRKVGRPVIMISSDGGTDIEITAQNNPEKIYKISVDGRLHAYQISECAYKMGFSKEQVAEFTQILLNMYKFYLENDCTLLEVNPMVMTSDGHFIAIDSKVNFDDNALFRHPDIVSLKDPNEEDPRELEAHKFNLNYIALDGNIACLVNGAGLAMATMDMIKYYGSNPANFLDIGGGANEEQIAHAFQIIVNDKNVKAILVNIFGGIVRCDIVAQSIINVAQNGKLNLPIIVRLEGTNVDMGRKLLKESGLNIIPATDLDVAVKSAISAIK